MNMKNRAALLLRQGWLSIALLTLLGVMTGCGGGGKGGTTPAPVVNADPTGYYDITGTASVKQSDNTTALDIKDLQGLVYNAQLYMFSAATGYAFDGPMIITGNNFTATVTIYNNGYKVTMPIATISGTITPGKSIQGTLTGSAAGNGSFTLNYAAINNPDAALSTIQRGGYVWRSPIGGSAKVDPFNLIIDVAGAFSNAGPGGTLACDITGKFTPIAGAHLYSVTATMSNCFDPAAAGTYTGLASTYTQTNPNDVLVMVVTDHSIRSMDGDFK